MEGNEEKPAEIAYANGRSFEQFHRTAPQLAENVESITGVFTLSVSVLI